MLIIFFCLFVSFKHIHCFFVFLSPFSLKSKWRTSLCFPLLPLPSLKNLFFEFQVKSYNQELAQQVQTLSKRIDGRLTANNNNSNHSSRKSSSVMFPDYDDQNGRRGSNDPESLVDYEEMRNLKSKVLKPSVLLLRGFIAQYNNGSQICGSSLTLQVLKRRSWVNNSFTHYKDLIKISKRS